MFLVSALVAALSFPSTVTNAATARAFRIGAAFWALGGAHGFGSNGAGRSDHKLGC